MKKTKCLKGFEFAPGKLHRFNSQDWEDKFKEILKDRFKAGEEYPVRETASFWFVGYQGEFGFKEEKISKKTLAWSFYDRSKKISFPIFEGISK